MVGSMDSLDFCTELPVTEKNAIPLDCWNNICLSNIWIPSHLLPNRSKPSNIRATQGVYHTLEKKDPSKYMESFSVYSYSDVESEQGEIFVSDSDEDIFISGSDPTSLEKIETESDNKLPTVAVGSYVSNECGFGIGNNSETDISTNGSERKDTENINQKMHLVMTGKIPYLDEVFHKDCEEGRKFISSEENLMNRRKNLEDDQNAVAKNFSNNDVAECSMNLTAAKEFCKIKTNDLKNDSMQGMTGKIIKDTDSRISLNEILDVTPEVNIKDFEYDFKKRDESSLLSAYDIKERNPKKSKKGKVKKSSKYIRLDKFLENSVDISQDYYCDRYVQTILKEKYKKGNFNDLSVGSKAEFPDLATEGCKFIHSDKKVKETEGEVSFYEIRSDLNKPEEINKNENIDVEEIKPSVTDTKYGKIIIENIPPDVTKDGISIILNDYGEIKNLSLIPAGKFFTAYVEIDNLICDIDWIIECLNGSEPFGESPKKLLCYKQ